jgi:hypothetical protein
MNDVKKLKKRKEKFEYSGKLADYQEKMFKEGSVREVYQFKSYTPYQNKLYKRALYGLRGIDQRELEFMSEERKEMATRLYVKGQIAINLYKQKVTNKLSNMIFEEFFPDSPITDFFVNYSETSKNFKNTLTFKDLNIEKEHIITIFMEEGILPKNFHQLEKDPNQLPRLKK